MDQNNKEVITFEVGNFVFDVSVKTPSYIQADELNQLFKDEMILIIRKKLFELNQRFYVAHSITKKVDKLEQQKQNQLQNNLDTNMPNEQTTPPLYNRELIKNNDPIIKSENPIENAAINAYNSNSSIGQNTLQQSEPKQNVTQILNQIPNQQNIPPIIKENINNPIIKPNFSIKNFKVNEYKSLKIENDINDNLVISDIKIPDNLGISYNPTTMSIEGIPKIAGEYQITFLWASNEQHKTSGSIKLNIIDDPRNLWKNLPSDKNDKYFKEDVDLNFNSNRYYDIFVASKRGRSHAHVGSFRDDDFSIYTNQEKDYSIMMVADGAGSAKYSREGSKIACNIASNIIKTNIDNDFDTIKNELTNAFKTKEMRKIQEKFYYILGAAYKSSVEEISKVSSAIPTPYKDFSTTLLIAVTFKIENSYFVASIMVGDGAISIYSENSSVIQLLGEPDGGEFAGQTRFLDSSIISQGLWERVNVQFIDKPTSIMLMTDGVSDPYFETDNGLKNKTLWDKLWFDVKPTIEMKSSSSELLNWLDFFTPGHHDDRTIAIMKFK
ncbi:PP2C family serine/threonine-protein phosphatase [Aliarcobacter butzleri]|uniref:PP2C family serine/threonine-protein phosphatase n=1 Tax=Aliarcobacter butzleri TaxID=28197 RepID=UPI0021B2AB58|nr:PP2C family serine/threonine-protein phosphatase [Aliarcobacter butzleri]MCT7557191.1 protein phosphatase 2C domain-containing protein [Aliarcobacter butzleri]